MRRAVTVCACVLALAVPALADPVALSADRPFGTLSGTLERTSGPPRAAALILPGSGPTDRDGNSPLGLSTDAYRLLAEALAAQSIATLRIDKRGIGASAGDPNAVSLAAYRTDTAAWVEVLLAETGDPPCVWLIGHSEGAILAADAATLPDICGLVLLTAPGRPLEAVLREQISAVSGFAPFIPAFDAALAQLVETGAPDTTGLPPGLATLFQPATRAYLRELVTTDPAAQLAATDLPVLVIHGDADLQVPPSEGDPLAAARPDALRLVLPGMTHTLKQAIPQAEAESPEAFAAASLATYGDPSLPLHPGLVPVITEFVLQTR